MEDLTTSINDLKQKYREIFAVSVEQIQKRIDELKPEECGEIIKDFIEGLDE